MSLLALSLSETMACTAWARLKSCFCIRLGLLQVSLAVSFSILSWPRSPTASVSSAVTVLLEVDLFAPTSPAGFTAAVTCWWSFLPATVFLQGFFVGSLSFFFAYVLHFGFWLSCSFLSFACLFLSSSVDFPLSHFCRVNWWSLQVMLPFAFLPQEQLLPLEEEIVLAQHLHRLRSSAWLITWCVWLNACLLSWISCSISSD